MIGEQAAAENMHTARTCKIQNIGIKWIFYTHSLAVISWFNQMQYAKYVVFYFVVSARHFFFHFSCCSCICVWFCWFSFSPLFLVFYSSFVCAFFYLFSSFCIQRLRTLVVRIRHKIGAIKYRARMQGQSVQLKSFSLSLSHISCAFPLENIHFH